MLHHASGEYEELQGWTEDLSDADRGGPPGRRARLPAFIEDVIGVPIALIGVGPGRDQVIWTEAEQGDVGRRRVSGPQPPRRRPKPTMHTTPEQKGAAFRALHEGAPFIIPNPWDAGSARVFEALGFKALATTQLGLRVHARPPRRQCDPREMIDHVRSLDQATSLPVSVDLENGYGPEPDDAALAIARAAQAGAVGGSIEDYDPSGRLYGFDHAVERVAAACEAARRVGFPFTLTARAENHIRGNPDLEDTIARLQAYERAGADVLYAPGLRSADEIRAVCAATSKPVNVLAHPRLSMAEVVAAGAQRVSVGGALAWVAVGAMAAAAEQMLSRGDFSVLCLPGPDRGMARRLSD